MKNQIFKLFIPAILKIVVVLMAVFGLFGFISKKVYSDFQNTPKTAENSLNTPKVNWTGFSAGYADAKNQKKILLIDLYTDWCGWCKRMDADTYSKKNVAELINQHFVAVKLNPEKEATYSFQGKQLNGEQLKQAITIGQFEGYPATIFINTAKNDEIKVVTGYHKPQEFITLLNSMK